MPMSFDVRLPRDQVPRFPDLCVCCLEEQPSETLAISEGTLSIARTFFFFLPRRKFSVEAPVCVRCRCPVS